jgi:hypothetical protein
MGAFYVLPENQQKGADFLLKFRRFKLNSATATKTLAP